MEDHRWWRPADGGAAPHLAAPISGGFLYGSDWNVEPSRTVVHLDGRRELTEAYAIL